MKTNQSLGASEVASPVSEATLPHSRNRSPLRASGTQISANFLVYTQSGLFERLAQPRIALPLLFACGGLLFFVNLGGYPLYTKGETREAVTVFDIVHGGGIVLPMRAGVEVPSKPLMMHWLAALVSLAAGQVNEWTVRLPSAVCALLGVIVCYCYVRRFFDEKSALIAALLLGTSFQYLQAVGARVDMMLTFLLELALFHFLAVAEGLSKRTAPLYLAIACAVLTKGPVGLALPALVAAIWIVLTRRTDVLRSLRLGRGAIVVGAIAGAWYLGAYATGGTAFISKQVFAENLYRLFGRQGFNEGHAHPFYYVEATLIVGFMPWSPVAVLATLRWWKQRPKIDSRISYMLVWFLAILIFYNLPHSKRGVYLLALYPALSTIVAVLLTARCELRSLAVERCTNLIVRLGGIFFIVAGISVLSGCAMLFHWTAPLHWILQRFSIQVLELPSALRLAADGYWPAVFLIPLAAIVIGAWMAVSPPSIERVVAGIAAGTIAIMLMVNVFVQPALAQTLSPKRFAIQANEYADSQTIYYFGSLDYGLIFYSGRDVKFVSVTHPSALVIGSEEQWRLMPPHFRVQYRVILRSNPTDLDGSGRLVLLSRINGSS